MCAFRFLDDDRSMAAIVFHFCKIIFVSRSLRSRHGWLMGELFQGPQTGQRGTSGPGGQVKCGSGGHICSYIFGRATFEDSLAGDIPHCSKRNTIGDSNLESEWLAKNLNLEYLCCNNSNAVLLVIYLACSKSCDCANGDAPKISLK